MSIGAEIAGAKGELDPLAAAQVIYRALFERGGGRRLSDSDRFIAMTAIAGGLVEWRKQILAAQEGKAAEWEKRYRDTKAELDDVRLKLAILQKER